MSFDSLAVDAPPSVWVYKISRLAKPQYSKYTVERICWIFCAMHILLRVWLLPLTSRNEEMANGNH